MLDLESLGRIRASCELGPRWVGFGFAGFLWVRDWGWSWVGWWRCRCCRGCCGLRSRRRPRRTSGCRGSRFEPTPSLLPQPLCPSGAETRASARRPTRSRATASPCIPGQSATSDGRSRRHRPRPTRHLRPHPPRSPNRLPSRPRPSCRHLPARHPRPRHHLQPATARRSSPRIEGEVGYPLRTACTSAAVRPLGRPPAIHRSKLREEGVSHLPPRPPQNSAAIVRRRFGSPTRIRAGPDAGPTTRRPRP